jgi:hydrogenase maturation factor HypF (carbamoyltransferase family)
MTRTPSKNKKEEESRKLKMFLVPCSCGTTFAVTDDYDRQGMHLRSFLPCPNCGKRHDPRNRLLQIGYERAGFWKVDVC